MENKSEKSAIEAYTTYANDRLFDTAGVLLRVGRGGPAFFIEQVLRASHVNYRMHTGEDATVDITLSVDGEHGSVTSCPKNASPRIEDASCVLVSTILDEWPLSAFVGYVNVYIDMQGYVRDEPRAGEKHIAIIPAGFEPACVKVTEEELAYLPEEFIGSQKRRILLITKGVRGITLFAGGEQHDLPPSTLVNASDTIGAGDTLFTHFLVGCISGLSPLDSVKLAMEKTSAFLLTKTM